eukprot:scaffold1219_cov400-Prasinococcus_capsulatus_cf.AAC.22
MPTAQLLARAQASDILPCSTYCIAAPRRSGLTSRYRSPAAVQNGWVQVHPFALGTGLFHQRCTASRPGRP